MDLSSTDNALLERLNKLARQAEQEFINGRLQEALHLYEDCFALTKNLSKQEQVPILLKAEFAPRLYQLGRALCEQKNLADGIRTLQHVVGIEHNLGDLKAEAALLSDIATIYFEQKSYENAIAIYRNDVLPLRALMNDTSGVARVHRNIGLAYAGLAEAAEAYTELKIGIEQAMDCGATQEARRGFETAIALGRQGLDLPIDIRQQLWELACLAEYWDLEPVFRKEKSNNQDEAAKNLQFRPLHVFISYSHHDRTFAASIAEWLDVPIFNIFLDQKRLYPGWIWESQLMDALQSADAFLLLLGNDTMNRKYVRKELETYVALQKSSTPRIIPVLLPDYVGDPPSELSSFQCYDLREGEGTLKESVRFLGNVIWKAYTFPHQEIELSPDRLGPRKIALPSAEDNSLEVKNAYRNPLLSPTAFVQMKNLGIIQGSTLCWHQELDMTSFQTKRCEKFADVLCIGCGTGACSDLLHLYERFCTLIPPQGLFEQGTKLFYWCQRCHAPICARCLHIEDEYPCPPNQVPMYRFHCPSCQMIIQVVSISDVDFKGAAEALLRWSKAGGPPEGQGNRIK